MFRDRLKYLRVAFWAKNIIRIDEKKWNIKNSN